MPRNLNIDPPSPDLIENRRANLKQAGLQTAFTRQRRKAPPFRVGI